MKLVQFSYKNRQDEIRVGYVDGDNVVDINKCNPELPSTLLGLLQKGNIERIKR